MPKVLILYHFYSPDDVVSAEQFTGLAEGLVQCGLAEPPHGPVASSGPQARLTQDPPLGWRASGQWEVEVWPANRSCHDSNLSYSTHPETLNGVLVQRVWRPAFRQHSFFGRILNSIWMQKAWAWRLLLNPSFKPDIILTGTDPIFSVGLSTFLKFIRPKAKFVHWCFDLYPEAAVADGVIGANNPLVKLLTFGLKRAYQRCDLVADLGPCMREKLERYGIGIPTPESPLTLPSPTRGEGNNHKTKVVTLTPWALEEPKGPLPIDVPERQALFGHSPLGLLYSGSFGRAHDFYLTLKLARLTRKSAVFTYSARGSRLAELNKAVNPEDNNVRFVDFAPGEKLAARLSSADVHIVSLRPEWTGTVVPSKFFGALAAGRPILFEGDPASSIARWIEEYKVGWVLSQENVNQIAEELNKFAGDEAGKQVMFKHCHKVYQAHFSKKAIIDNWDKELRTLLAE